MGVRETSFQSISNPVHIEKLKTDAYSSSRREAVPGSCEVCLSDRGPNEHSDSPGPHRVTQIEGDCRGQLVLH